MSTLKKAPSDWVRAGESGVDRSRLDYWRRTHRLIEGEDFVWVDEPAGISDRTLYYNRRSIERVQAELAPERRWQSAFPGGKLRRTFLFDGIRIKDAATRFGVSAVKIRKLVEQAKVAASLSRERGGNRRRYTLVSTGDLAAVVAGEPTSGKAGDGPAPADGERLTVLSREFDIPYPTLRAWCAWESHPGLGRPIQRGLGARLIPHGEECQKRWRGLLASRADVGVLADLIRKPSMRQIAANPGVWLDAEGTTFLHHDGQTYYTERYIRVHPEEFGLPKNKAYKFAHRHRSSENPLGNLRALRVVWPQARGTDPKAGKWLVMVFAKKDLVGLKERRAGRFEGGLWETPGLLWVDPTGARWYASRVLCEALGIDSSQLKTQYRDTGRLKLKKPVLLRGNKGPFKGQLTGCVIVHHESEVHPLLGMPSPERVREPVPDSLAVPAGRGRRPKRRDPAVVKVQTYCYDQAAAGDAWSSIARNAQLTFQPDKGFSPPLTRQDACTLARRHAEHNHLPWPPERPE